MLFKQILLAEIGKSNHRAPDLQSDADDTRPAPVPLAVGSYSISGLELFLAPAQGRSLFRLVNASQLRHCSSSTPFSQGKLF